MDDLFESEDDIKVNVGNNVFFSMTAVRFKFKLTKENVGFHFSQKRVDPFDGLNRELKTEQVVSGYSEPVDNSTLPAVVYKRQPFANKMFEGVSLYIHIVEQPPHQLLYPFYFHTRYYKDELTITLDWKVSDRSFFTRLVNQLSTKSFLTMEVTTDMADKDFEKYLIDKSLELPKVIGITSLILK
jgi:hypothetical protein